MLYGFSNKWIFIVSFHFVIKQIIFQKKPNDLYMNKSVPTIIEYSVQTVIDHSTASVKMVIKNNKRKLVTDTVIVE